MSIDSKNQAKQLLLSSQFITSYGNYDLRSNEAKQWLVNNGFNTNQEGTYTGIEALTGFTGGDGTYGERDRYARPELVGIYYNVANLPDWVEADYSSEEYKKMIQRKINRLQDQLKRQEELANKVAPMSLIELATWDPYADGKSAEDTEFWQGLYDRIISNPTKTKNELNQLLN